MALSLPRLQRIKDELGATLNDVVLTAVSGAVGRYHVHRKVKVDELLDPTSSTLFSPERRSGRSFSVA